MSTMGPMRRGLPDEKGDAVGELSAWAAIAATTPRSVPGCGDGCRCGVVRVRSYDTEPGRLSSRRRRLPPTLSLARAPTSVLASSGRLSSRTAAWRTLFCQTGDLFHSSEQISVRQIGGTVFRPEHQLSRSTRDARAARSQGVGRCASGRQDQPLRAETALPRAFALGRIDDVGESLRYVDESLRESVHVCHPIPPPPPHHTRNLRTSTLLQRRANNVCKGTHRTNHGCRTR
jgi:hypothetical protein